MIQLLLKFWKFLLPLFFWLWQATLVIPHMFWGLPDPDPLVKSTDPVRGSGHGSLYQQTKIVRKPWFLPFCNFFMTLYLWRMMLQILIWIRIRRIRVFFGLPDPHPDKNQNVTDPQHWWQECWPLLCLVHRFSVFQKMPGFECCFTNKQLSQSSVS